MRSALLRLARMGGVLGAVALTLASAPMPAPDRRWDLVYRDEFDGSTLAARWSRYDGRPLSDPRTRWDPSEVEVNGGVLRLGGAPNSSGWAAGAVSNWRDAQQYGRWQIRFRSMRHDVLSYHFLLWPKSEEWPPEIDIAESFDGSRRSVQGFVHWRDSDGRRHKTEVSATADFRDWHTVGVEWTPDGVRYLLDGVEWASVTGSAVPHEPMWLALQVETQACRSSGPCPGPAGPVVEVDWVQVDSWRPPSGAGGSWGSSATPFGG